MPDLDISRWLDALVARQGRLAPMVRASQSFGQANVPIRDQSREPFYRHMWAANNELPEPHTLDARLESASFEVAASLEILDVSRRLE
jgi:hypothetical protein